MTEGIAGGRHDIEIVVTSGEGWSKSRPAVERLLPELDHRVRLTVVCGAPDETPFPTHPFARTVVARGRNVFQVRAALPTVVGDAEWVALVEDHAVPHAGWVAALLAATGHAGPGEATLTGTATNEVSTGPWDWPNFLFNFAHHWHPSSATRLPGTVTTLVFRRGLLGDCELGYHEFESRILSRAGRVVNALKVDHIQRTPWWVASAHVFDNGLVAGSGNRRNSPTPFRHMWGSVRLVHGRRMREIAAILGHHPRRGALPTAIMLRLRWIGLCHSAGMVLGTLFGAGNAANRLE